MMKTGIIVLAHGSRGERGGVDVAEALNKITRGVKAFLPPEVKVIGATLQFNHPSLDEAVESLAAQKVSRVIIMPYFLFLGQHITEHVPKLIERFKCLYPEIQFTVSDNLGTDEYFIDLVAKRIIEAAPELLPRLHVSSSAPESIEQQSLEIVEKLLPPLELSWKERTVVKRLVHTAGDRHLAPLIRFHPTATTSALSAIHSRSPIFTDTRMVAVAINRHLAERFGCEIYCALDGLESAGVGREKCDTRSAAAFRLLTEELNKAIVAIGNSPTALLALLDLIVRKKVTPAVVIGMPVGFVQAREAKEELMKLDIPYISIVGTRGGSALAAATINALLGLAKSGQLLEERQHERRMNQERE
ncbi:MAG: hypothetical protein FJ006_08475 [Chloroflexi bacterium]|nr:hypothetical protein [Chloroflexota bacterium]